jgi:peptide/nickel transport system permease protein
MTAVPQTLSEGTKSKAGTSTLNRVARFAVIRLVTLFITVVIGVFLTIMIANMGGYVDEIMRSEIKERVIMRVAAMTANQDVTPEMRKKLTEDMIRLEEKRLGLDTPFMVRAFRYLGNALQLNLGRAVNMISDSGSRSVRAIILERLPATLLLMGTSELILFFSSVFIALSLSRNYGSIWDKMVIALSPTSAAPPWFYGIFFILIFAALLKILPFGGMVDAPPPTNPVEYTLSLLKHLILPGASLIFSSLFLSIYNWRTFFLIYSFCGPPCPPSLPILPCWSSACGRGRRLRRRYSCGPDWGALSIRLSVCTTRR